MFPSPYGVSFILMYLVQKHIEIFTSLRFPSPYGVSFILIIIFNDDGTIDIHEFPSPYGVSFILIN